MRATYRHEPSESIVNKALEQVRVQAQSKARQLLCHDCPNQQCRNGSLCKSFLVMTDSFAWEIIAEKAELN